MSRRKQLNPRPLGEYTRTKSQEPTSQDQGEIHKKIPQKPLFNDQMILPTGKDGQNGYVCPQCNMFLSNQHELTSHLRSHNGVNNSRSEHQCRQCWKILSSSSSLDRHMLTHSGEKPFSCRICKQAFTTNGNMHRHMRTHEKKNEQRRAAALLKPKNKSSSSSSSASKMDLFNESIVDITASKNSFRLSENVDMVSQSILKAAWSPSTQANISKKPASVSREDVNPKPNLPPSQQNEGLEPVLKYTLPPPSHPLQSSAGTSPRPSLYSSPTASPLNSITTMEFSCSKFPLICIAEGSKNGRRPKTAGQQEYGCEDCHSYFPCKKALDLHLQTHYTDQPTSCEVCDLTFSSPENYQQHRFRYHTDANADENQAAFMNSLNLISNQNNSKMAELSPSCEDAIDEGSLAPYGHMSEDTEPDSVSPHDDSDEHCEEDDMHSFIPKEDPLSDSECGGIPSNDFHQDESNNKNQISIVAEKTSDGGNAKKKASYTCTYCNKDFINTRAAKSHERSHLGLSPYQCKSCSYSSPDKSTLIRHMRTHNGERPYQCKLCNYAFTTKANCERHVKKKHNIVNKEELEAKVGYNKDTKENQDDSFSSPDTVCKYCNKDFKYFRRLKHHLRGHRSSEEKPFKCKQCEMGFSTKANCVRHIQNKHTDISHVDIENHVQVQESLLTSFMGHSGSPRCTSAPPPAHSPAVRFSDDSAEDVKPLDLRSSRNVSQCNSPAVNGGGGGGGDGSFICIDDLDNNEPIDLSVKRTVKKAIRKMPSIPDSNTKCPYDDQDFGSEPECHTKMSHDRNTNPDDRRFSFLKQLVPNYMSPKGPVVSRHENSSTPLTKKIKMEPNLSKDQSLNIDDGPSDDLASVSQILNTTATNSFEAYFANHDDDPVPPPSRQRVNGYNSSPSEFGNDVAQVKDEPCDIEDSEYITGETEECNLNNSSDSKDMVAKLEPEGDSSQKSQKKKRNSYADSPHKLKCPHCPRHFPWASSLNRHILTHTGEKPFECPKCHVIFSTKSNRERHLTRKHGVNMLDPASRQTMDRPFKCHLCTFSSFATKDFLSLENLVRHYRDRHPEDQIPEGINDGSDKPPSSDSSPLQQKTKFLTGSSNIRMELKSPESVEKNSSDECGLISSKLAEREKTFQEEVGTKTEEFEINNNNPLHWTQKQTELQSGNVLTSQTTLCYLCGYKSSNPQLLQQHMKVHSKDSPFKCHMCEMSFPERIRCIKHLEKMHRAEWSRLTNKNKIPNLEELSDEVGQRCQEYVEQLSDCEEPNSHMTGYLDRKVFCCLCTERFWSKQDLQPHMLSHPVCQLSDKDTIIPSNVSETDPLLAPTTLPRGSSDLPAKTEEPDILPTMLGMDASSIDRLLDSAMAGGRLSTYIP